MAPADRENEERKAVIDGGEPIPPKCCGVLFANRQEAEMIWPGKSLEIISPRWVNR